MHVKKTTKLFSPSSLGCFILLVLTIIFFLSLSILLQQAMAESIINSKSEKMLVNNDNLTWQNSDTRMILSKSVFWQWPSSFQAITNGTKNKINTTTTTSLTYKHPSLGITMQYPSNWLKKEYPYNPVINNTLVTFFSPSPSASALGNVSGVSGSFVPYIDIFVFASKNMSLNEIVNGTVNNLAANANLNESKSITLKDNNPAYTLTYTVTIAGNGSLKKMQVWTLKDYKVYVITFTAEEALYSKYLPTIQKMINSLEIRNPTVK
jgi:PsbP-like protein